MGKLFDGKTFKKYYGRKFFKVTNASEKHFDTQYYDGLNVDKNPLTQNMCTPGGICFTNYEDLPEYFHLGIYVREIDIPDDAMVYCEDMIFKSDKLIFLSRILIKDFVGWNDFDFCLNAVKRYGDNLQYVGTQTQLMCNHAVYGRSCFIKHVNDCFQLPNLCQYAIKSDKSNIQFITNTTFLEKLIECPKID